MGARRGVDSRGDWALGFARALEVLARMGMSVGTLPLRELRGMGEGGVRAGAGCDIRRWLEFTFEAIRRELVALLGLATSCLDVLYARPQLARLGSQTVRRHETLELAIASASSAATRAWKWSGGWL